MVQACDLALDPNALVDVLGIGANIVSAYVTLVAFVGLKGSDFGGLSGWVCNDLLM